MTLIGDENKKGDESLAKDIEFQRGGVSPTAAKRTSRGIDLFTDGHSALGREVGDTPYSKMPIGPTEFCHRNKIGAGMSAIIRRACSYELKPEREELEKLIHEAEIIMELDWFCDDLE